MFQVFFSKQFKFGNSQSSFFRDFPHMKQTQKELLFAFCNSFLDGKHLCGKNKSNNYFNNNIFHYHIGYPQYNSFNLNCNHNYCYQLVENLQGFESAGVIYYLRKSDNIIVLLSFGEKHIPFPEDSTSNILNIRKNDPTIPF